MIQLTIDNVQSFPGTIDVKEMIEIVGNLYEMEGFSKVAFMKLTCVIH